MVGRLIDAPVLAGADDILQLVFGLIRLLGGLARLGSTLVGRIVLVLLACVIAGLCVAAVWQAIKSHCESRRGGDSDSGLGEYGTSARNPPTPAVSHQDKGEEFIKEMAHFGVHPSAAVPPMYRLFWRMGIELPPPLFQSSREIVFFVGGPFGVLFGVGVYLMQSQAQRMPLVVAVVCAVIAGALFGLAVAWYYHRMAQQYVLPSWSEYERDSITRRS